MARIRSRSKRGQPLERLDNREPTPATEDLGSMGEKEARMAEKLAVTPPSSSKAKTTTNKNFNAYRNRNKLPFREEVTRDWGFPKPEKHGHWRVYGTDVVKRFAAYIPDQAVLAYRGEDPVTGEWEGAFLLPRSAARYRWIVEKLGTSVSLFSGPEL